MTAEPDGREPLRENRATPDPHSDEPRSPRPKPVMSGILQMAQELQHALQSTIATLEQRLAPQPTLTHREVVRYLIELRPPGADVRGALLRKRLSSGYAFHLLFIDAAGNPLVDQRTGRRAGRSIRALDCDAELHDIFGAKDLIIFD